MDVSIRLCWVKASILSYLPHQALYKGSRADIRLCMPKPFCVARICESSTMPMDCCLQRCHGSRFAEIVYSIFCASDLRHSFSILPLPFSFIFVQSVQTCMPRSSTPIAAHICHAKPKLKVCFTGLSSCVSSKSDRHPRVIGPVDWS